MATKTSLPDLIRRRFPNLRGPGVVAVSGGADSVALLRVLADLAKPFLVAHVNHRLRGAESDADELFVVALAKTLGLECQTIAIDVAEVAQANSENLEGTARRRRYGWFAELAVDIGASWIATGHTADDQAETVLHRLLRGTGIQGLRGIALQRELRPGIRLIRPMIDATRQDILAYLDQLKQTWREDHTNRDTAFTRNRIRHELLPLMKTFNPGIRDVLCRLAEQASEIQIEQDEATAALLARSERPLAGPMRILDARILKEASRPHVRHLFRAIWEREGWPLGDMSFAHWQRLVDIAHGEQKAVDFPGGIVVRRKGNAVQVGRAEVT